MHSSNVIEENVKGVTTNSIKGYFNIIHSGVILGKNTTVGNYCEIGKNTIIGDNCIFQSGVRTGNNVTIYDNITIKFGSSLTEGMIIHSDTFVGPSVIFLGSNHKRQTSLNNTIIGKNCYISAGVKVMPGIQIHDNIIIGANSFVNKNIEEPGVYVGNPCKKIK